MRKLEQLLDMPDARELMLKEKQEEKKELAKAEKAEPIFRSVKELDKISEALPKVKGLGDVSDSELDELARRATEAYDDLMDLGMNVEARYASRIFEVASSMLKNAIDAKTAKIDKKLKMIDLQMKRYKLKPELDEPDDAEKLSSKGVTMSRSSLLEKLKTMNKES